MEPTIPYSDTFLWPFQIWAKKWGGGNWTPMEGLFQMESVAVEEHYLWALSYQFLKLDFKHPVLLGEPAKDRQNFPCP